MSLVTLEDVEISVGARTLAAGLSLRVSEADRFGIVGPNGSGKSTLLRVISGQLQPDRGVCRTSKNVRIGFLPQDLVLNQAGLPIDFVMASVPGKEGIEQAIQVAEQNLARAVTTEEQEVAGGKLAELVEELGHFETHYTRFEALEILAGLGFQGRTADRELQHLSGGWKMRAVLAALLFQRPDVLLLDEPTNHLDMPTVAWFSSFLSSYPRAFFLISHDREFLNEQIRKVVSFEPEGVRIYEGNYERYLEQRKEEEIILVNRSKNLERERDKAEAFIGRFRAQASKAKAVQSRIKALEKMDDVVLLGKHDAMNFRLAPTERAGHEVLRIRNVSKDYGQEPVLKNVDLTVYRGDRIGLVGPNGAGKTTLLRIVAGELPASDGDVELGYNVKPGYFAQHHAEGLTAKNTIYGEIAAAGKELGETRIRTLLGALLFHGDDVKKTIQVLSGGERARVALAKLLVDPGNVLLLDEPTNHLDLDSCERLIEALAGYDGTMVFVSHNRALLRRLCTKIWSVEEGVVREYPGNLDDYLELYRASSKSDVPTQQSSGQGSSSAKVARGESAKPDPVGAAKRQRDALRRQNEKRITTLEKEVTAAWTRVGAAEAAMAELNDRLCDPSNTAHPDRHGWLNDLQKLQTALDVASVEWEKKSAELELCRESVDTN